MMTLMVAQLTGKLRRPAMLPDRVQAALEA